MNCPSCGTALTQELSFCNRCGANLDIVKGSSQSKSLEKSIESTVWTIAGITISMLGIMIAVMALMKSFRLSGGMVILFMALMFLILLGLDGLFVWQLMRLNSRAKEARSGSQSERFTTTELDAQREPVLLEYRDSVTEGTTRILEPMYEERRTK